MGIPSQRVKGGGGVAVLRRNAVETSYVFTNVLSRAPTEVRRGQEIKI